MIFKEAVQILQDVVPATQNISAWIGIIGAVVAIAISIFMKKPQGDNLNAGTIKSLTESVGVANDNYDKVVERLTALEKTVAEYECWNRALCAQLISVGKVPISLEQAVLNSKKSARTIE